jgi:hypothetical protein
MIRKLKPFGFGGFLPPGRKVAKREPPVISTNGRNPSYICSQSLGMTGLAHHFVYFVFFVVNGFVRIGLRYNA